MASTTATGLKPAEKLPNGLATYASGDAFDQSDAAGFVRLYGLGLKTWSATQGEREA